MVVDDQGALVADLQSLVGEDLRVIAEYDPDGYDAFYVRDDVTPRIGDIAEELHDDLVLQGVGRERLEDIFDAGTLHCSMHRFDDLTAFHFVRKEFTGLFVSVDSDGNVPLSAFADACKSRLS